MAGEHRSKPRVARQVVVVPNDGAAIQFTGSRPEQGRRPRRIEKDRIPSMASRSMTIEQILAILRETPSRLSVVTGDATETQLHASPHPGEWSAVDVLAHLRSCGDVWGDAIERIITEDQPTIRAVSPTTWIEATDYRGLQFGPSLRAFARQRARLLRLIGPLAHEGWLRSATVLGAGKPLDLTVHAYAYRLARHERTHRKQMEKTVKSILG